jgi:hypothetical protein
MTLPSSGLTILSKMIAIAGDTITGKILCQLLYVCMYVHLTSFLYVLDYGAWTQITTLNNVANSINGFQGWIAQNNTVIGLQMQS